MKTPSTNARRAYTEIVNDMPTRVYIKGTNRSFLIRGMKPYTIERLTQLWSERDMYIADDTAGTMKSLCSEPYFNVKQAALMTLNSYFKIKFFFRLRAWIWGKLIGYTEEQMMPIVQEGKKKLPLTAHWTNMAFSTDMRNDWMKMTTKEAEQYRAELLSVANQLSSKNSHPTADQD